MVKIHMQDTDDSEGVQFIVTVSNDELENLIFTDLEARMIRKAIEGILTPTLMACILLMITRKIEAQHVKEVKNG